MIRVDYQTYTTYAVHSLAEAKASELREKNPGAKVRVKWSGGWWLVQVGMERKGAK